MKKTAQSSDDENTMNSNDKETISDTSDDDYLPPIKSNLWFTIF